MQSVWSSMMTSPSGASDYIPYDLLDRCCRCNNKCCYELNLMSVYDLKTQFDSPDLDSFLLRKFSSEFRCWGCYKGSKINI